MSAKRPSTITSNIYGCTFKSIKHFIVIEFSLHRRVNAIGDVTLTMLWSCSLATLVKVRSHEQKQTTKLHIAMVTIDYKKRNIVHHL